MALLHCNIAPNQPGLLWKAFIFTIRGARNLYQEDIVSLPFDGQHVAQLIDDGRLPKPRWQSRSEALRLQQRLAVEGGRAPPRRTTEGAFTGLCLLVGFPDLPLPPQFTRAEIDAYCNAPGYQGFGNNGSVRDYFHEVSGGRLEYRTLVAPPYEAQHPRSHYTDPGVPFGQRARELVRETLESHIAAGLDFSSLSVDPQKGVYAINLLYAGDPGAWGQGLWPHASRLDRALRLAPGRNAMDYQISALADGPTLGVYCHENGHMLCDFPDLYPYDKQETGVGQYCLMGLGAVAAQTNPTQVCAYLKFKAGWGEAREVQAGENLLPFAQPNRFLIHRRDAHEYLLLELRRGSGRDALLHEEGVAVWHVDEQGSNTWPEQQVPGHQHAECVLLQADGLREVDTGAELGDEGDLLHPDRSSAPRGFRWKDGASAGLVIEALRSDSEGFRLIARLE
jgi:M6 family metalloprotease-like protein